MEQPEVSFDEKIHASAVQFLIQENDKEAAMALLRYERVAQALSVPLKQC